MSRRRSIRPKELDGALEVLNRHGLTPCAIEVMGDGALRLYFQSPVITQNDALDRELAEFEDRHGQG